MVASPPDAAEEARRHDAELAGLAALDAVTPQRPSWPARAWSAAWPKLLAVVLALFAWQLVVWSGWKSEAVLPPPRTVFRAFVSDFPVILEGALITLRRGLQGYAIALAIGIVVGAAVARVRVLRSAVGSLVTGLQTMPSIAWFPAAIVLFALDERAILFVVVLGAAPSIANGFIHGVDHIPPILLRAGYVLGARRLRALWHVILPAALPSFLAGMKQGWAFAWRSLLAGELLVQLGGLSLGQQLKNNQDLADYPAMYAVMLAILLIGILVDALGFGTAERALRRRYGLVDGASR